MSDLHGIHDPVPFDHAAADALVAQLKAGAGLLRAQKKRRNDLATIARKDWRGVYDGKFAARMTVCLNDADRLADAMDKVAEQVKQLAKAATEEQQRRDVAKKYEHDLAEWKHRHEGALNVVRDVAVGPAMWAFDPKPKPPSGPKSEPVLPVKSPVIKDR